MRVKKLTVRDISEIKFYILALLIGSIVELILFAMYGSPYLYLDAIFIIFIFLVRFLSGLGIFSTFSLAAMYILKYFSPYFRGSKKRSERFLTLLNLLMILAFLGLVTYSVFTTIIGKFNLTTSIIGILTVVLSYYISPIWKAESKAKINDSLLDEIKEAFRGIKLDIVRGYYKYISREYLKAYSIDYIKFRAKWDKFRYKASIYMVPLIALSSVILPFFLILFAFLVIRLFILRINYLSRIDYIVISSYSIAAIYILVFVHATQFIYQPILWLFPYLMGLLVSFVAYINAMFFHGRPLK